MKQWKALTALVLCLILALSLVPASAWAAEEAPASASWADGTYEGTGAGFGGDVDAVSPDTPCTRAQIVTFLDRATAG